MNIKDTLTFKTEQHEKVLTAILDRKKLSDRKLEGYHKLWNKAEEFSQGYIRETEADKIRKQRKTSKGRVDYTTIEIPYAYGMMMSAHTYSSAVFLGRSPVLQYLGRHGESQQNVMAVEALMEYQTVVGRHKGPYYIWLYDALKYGLGVIMFQWEVETTQVSKVIQVPKTQNGVRLENGETEEGREITTVKGFEGNRIYNVKPYDVIADPRVSLMQFQEGEFFGRRFDTSWTKVVEKMTKGRYFNKEAMRNNLDKTKKDQKQSPQSAHPDTSGDDTMSLKMDDGYIQGIDLVVRLIPKDWGLGESTSPEKWVFTVGNEKVIIGAEPLSHFHGKFPFGVIEQEIEGYNLIKQGMPEQTRPLNDIMTWLFNSHFYNVRAAMNNQFIIDPSKVSIKDMERDEPGFIATIKPTAQGTDLRTAMHQFPVSDVTSGHLSELENVGQLSQRAFGVVDNVMGMVNPGGRKTATEVRTSSSFAVNRLKTVAEYQSAWSWEPVSQMLLQQTQQYYSSEKKFRLVGDLTGGDPFVNVDGDTIAGFYDYVPVDGSMPIDRFAQANLFRELLVAVRQLPQVAATYDMGGMFAWIAQLAGMRNIHQFKINMGAGPGQVEGEVAKGNMVPVEEVRNLTEPGQVSGVGPTG